MDYAKNPEKGINDLVKTVKRYLFEKQEQERKRKEEIERAKKRELLEKEIKAIKSKIDGIIVKLESDVSDAYGRLKQFEIITNEQERIKKEHKTKGSINNHEYVDLGLPSGLKWATCNVGANKPEEYGDYLAWGEITTKKEYTDKNSVTYGERMGDISSNTQYDVARAICGGTWRMPTKSECQELINECTCQWTPQGGKNGYKVTGPNGNSIFLPAAGGRYWSSLIDAGDGRCYWSSTPYESNTYSAYYLYFNSGNHYVNWSNRYYGQSVRPISE